MSEPSGPKWDAAKKVILAGGHLVVHPEVFESLHESIATLEDEVARLGREWLALAGAIEVARNVDPTLKRMPTFAKALALLQSEGSESGE